jgi:hypothetical protein
MSTPTKTVLAVRQGLALPRELQVGRLAACEMHKDVAKVCKTLQNRDATATSSLSENWPARPRYAYIEHTYATLRLHRVKATHEPRKTRVFDFSEISGLFQKPGVHGHLIQVCGLVAGEIRYFLRKPSSYLKKPGPGMCPGTWPTRARVRAQSRAGHVPWNIPGHVPRHVPGHVTGNVPGLVPSTCPANYAKDPM